MRPTLRKRGLAPSIGGAALLILCGGILAAGFGLLVMIVAKAVG